MFILLVSLYFVKGKSYEYSLIIYWTALVPSMKSLGLVVSDKKSFENCSLKTYFLTPWPTYATNQNHLNILLGEHPGTIPVEFGHITISGSREDVVWTFP